MASAYISEYQELARDAEGNLVQAGQEPAVATQKVTYSTAQSSSAFNGVTRFIRVITDADAHLSFDGTATADDLLLKANNVEYFGVYNATSVSIYDGSS